MKEITHENFGLLIAYLLPGFTVLWGFSYFNSTLRLWLGTSPANSPSLGGFLYITIGSIAAGLTVSTIRWLLIDSLHHATGISQPNWDFSMLQQNIDGYDRLIEIHYRYYQFYANMLVALCIASLARRVSLGFWTTSIGWYDLGFLMLMFIFMAGSRDTLKKYYSRTEQLFQLARVGECDSELKNGDPQKPKSDTEITKKSPT